MINDTLLSQTYIKVKICCNNIANSISHIEASTQKNKALSYIDNYYIKTDNGLEYKRYNYLRDIILKSYFDKIIPTP